MTPQDKATPVPWCVQSENHIWCGDADSPNAPLFAPQTRYRQWGREISMEEHCANAALIVQSVNERAALIAERDGLREALELVLEAQLGDETFSDIWPERAALAKSALSPSKVG